MFLTINPKSIAASVLWTAALLGCAGAPATTTSSGLGPGVFTAVLHHVPAHHAQAGWHALYRNAAQHCERLKQTPLAMRERGGQYDDMAGTIELTFRCN